MTKLTHFGLTLIAGQLRKKIYYNTEQRNAKNKHVVYSDFPDIRDMRTRIYWGVYSWTLPSEKRRWLLSHSALDVDGMICSPADIVRDYLDTYHPHRLRATGLEARSYEALKSAPLYIRPSICREACYIDIKSTYYSIVTLLGWDIGYLPGQWLTAGRAPLDFPLPKDKPARNYLVSIGRPSTVITWTGAGWELRRAFNVHINLALWSVTMDILHSIANIAVALGAVYVNTDGYILPSKQASTLISEISKFHLTPEVRAEGQAAVFGFGNWSVGEKHTKNYLRTAPQRPLTKIYQVPSEWLREAISKIVLRNIPDILYKRSMGA